MTIIGRAAHALRAHAALVLVGLFVFVAGPAWSADVSDRVTVSRSGLIFNRLTDTYDTTATLKNTSSVAVSAPVTLEVSNLLTPSVTLANAAGTNGNNRPFVNVAGSLSPGAQATVVLRFANPQT